MAHQSAPRGRRRGRQIASPPTGGAAGRSALAPAAGLGRKSGPRDQHRRRPGGAGPRRSRRWRWCHRASWPPPHEQAGAGGGVCSVVAKRTLHIDISPHERTMARPRSAKALPCAHQWVATVAPPMPLPPPPPGRGGGAARRRRACTSSASWAGGHHPSPCAPAAGHRWGGALWAFQRYASARGLAGGGGGWLLPTAARVRVRGGREERWILGRPAERRAAAAAAATAAAALGLRRHRERGGAARRLALWTPRYRPRRVRQALPPTAVGATA